MSEDPRSDSEIIGKILAGEVNFFGTLVERYEKLMFSFLLPQVRSLQEVEDISQEAFVKAFKHLRSFDTQRRFSSWLLKIAKNLMINYFRKNITLEKSDGIIEFLANKASASVSGNPEKKFEAQEEFRKTFLEMIQLPEELKVPFLLRIMQDLSYEEIAEILDLPLQTVKNRIFKARKTLREKRKNENVL